MYAVYARETNVGRAGDICVYGDKSQSPSAPPHSPHDLFESPKGGDAKTQAKLEIEVLKSKSHKSQMSQVKSACQTVHGGKARIWDLDSLWN